jgi:integrase
MPARVRKPRPDFPLFCHATGRWAKKIRQKLVYFGKTTGDEKGQAALEKWLDQKDDLLAGRTPRVKADGLTIRELANRFAGSKKNLLDAREISPRYFGEVLQTCQIIIDSFGPNRLVTDLASDDFANLRKSMAKLWGPVRLGNTIGRVRSVFKFAAESRLIPQPVLFGPGFKKPSATVLRINRTSNGNMMFEAAELRTILEAAVQPMKAMVLLGVNCGYGPSDVARLPLKALDLTGGWADFPRPKTGVPRRCPLWPETVAAVQEAIAGRPAAKRKADAGLAFLTAKGRPWQRSGIVASDAPSGEVADIRVSSASAVVDGFTKLIKRLGLHRRRRGFYALRHGFETVAGDSRDQVAVDYIMGHARDDMASVYRERIDDARLVAVVEHVRKWLFQENETK